MRRLIFPFILIITAIFLRKALPAFEPAHQQLLDNLPYVVLGLAGMLCVYFNRARAFTAACAFMVMYYLIEAHMRASLAGATTLFIYTAMSVLLPVTLMLLIFLPERGLRNKYGMLMVSTVPLGLMLALIIHHTYPEAVWTRVINTWLPIHPFTNYMLSVPASMAFVLAGMAGLFRLIRHDSEYDAMLVVLVVTGLVALVRFDLPRMPMVMFSVAGITLVVSLLRSSHEMAYRDDLTGLLGRRAFNERLKGLGRGYVIAMLDVDHFKNFNDTYGHDVGDDVLKMVARQIARVKGGGIAYRYGGEEFAIVFPGRDIEDCRSCLEDVRRAVENYRMLVRNRKQRPQARNVAEERRGRRTTQRDGKSVSVTISIGVSAPKNRQNSVAEVLKAADAALYKAKQNGRNCLAVR
jgi:diguanylate cyclase (GGDEF)-like protein